MCPAIVDPDKKAIRSFLGAIMAGYFRRVIPALVGFLLGALLWRLFRGTWQWGTLIGALIGAAVILVILLVWERLRKT